MKRLLLIVAAGCGTANDSTHLHTQTKTVAARNPAPDVMIALDVSEAMAPQLPGLTGALSAFVAANPEAMAWGLMEFPSAAQPTCADEVVDTAVPIPTLTESQLSAQSADVMAALNAVSPRGDRDAVIAVHDAAFADPDRDHFVFLITSGEDACGNSLATAALDRRSDGVRTLVVGYGPSAPWLDDTAVTAGFRWLCPGGTDSECGPNNTCGSTGACTHTAYLAHDPAELTEVLNALFTPLGSAALCNYTLEVVPASQERVTVFLNGAQIPPGADTWQLSGDQVLFKGAVCHELGISTAQAPVTVTVVVDDRS